MIDGSSPEKVAFLLQEPTQWCAPNHIVRQAAYFAGNPESTASLCEIEACRDCQGHSHPSAPSVKVSTLTSSLSGLPVTAPVGCPISTKDESKAWIPERVMAMSASNLM